MGKATLVSQELEGESKLISDGARLIKFLDESGFHVVAALWLYLSESDEWRLIIASPSEIVKGPRQAYIDIQSVLSNTSPPIEIPLQDISVVSPSDRLIQSLKGLISTGTGIASLRIKNSVLNNQFIEDAYIYRMLG